MKSQWVLSGIAGVLSLAAIVSKSSLPAPSMPEEATVAPPPPAAVVPAAPYVPATPEQGDRVREVDVERLRLERDLEAVEQHAASTQERLEAARRIQRQMEREHERMAAELKRKDREMDRLVRELAESAEELEKLREQLDGMAGAHRAIRSEDAERERALLDVKTSLQEMAQMLDERERQVEILRNALAQRDLQLKQAEAVVHALQEGRVPPPAPAVSPGAPAAVQSIPPAIRPRRPTNNFEAYLNARRKRRTP